MPTYIFLGKYTDQGIKGIKNEEKNREEGLKMAEKLGIKFIGLYYVMGEYDMIAICECPSDEVVVSFVLTASSQGILRIKTLKVFTMEEFDKIVNKLP